MIVTDPGRFSRWVDQSPGVPTKSIEAFVWHESYWRRISFQIDDLSDSAVIDQIKAALTPGFEGLFCVGDATADPPSTAGPCEYSYDLRGSDPPSGELTQSDELVFLAGDTWSCGAPTSSWPAGDFEPLRYRILVSDDTEQGCVYLFRRLSPLEPPESVADLIAYDVTGDGEPAECRPITAACGAIVAEPYDGYRSLGIPSYRVDFRGNWTIDKLFIGENCPASTPCPEQDIVDLVKWRINNPDEHERLWDLYQEGEKELKSSCGSFVGYIDGPVRVIRVVQGSQSGFMTRKLEFAYPGEMTSRVYMRVHRVGGPIYTYADLTEANVSASSTAKVFKSGYTSSQTDYYDLVNGQQDANGPFDANEWYQVSAEIGSFLLYRREDKLPANVQTSGAYDDSQSSIWNVNQEALPEWDDETGDRAAARTQWTGFGDTQNKEECKDPRLDIVTPIFEHNLVMLSAGFAASSHGLGLLQNRNDAFRVSVREEVRGEPIPPPPPFGGTLVLFSEYQHDGGAVSLTPQADFGSASLVGWNVYQSVGAGVYRRLASLGLNEPFADVTLALNEERTYRATVMDWHGRESNMSDSVTVLHDDTVAPSPPTEASAIAAGTAVTVTWTPSVSGDVVGYKVMAATSSGGPYEQVHPGLLDRLKTSWTFESLIGQTVYVVVRAVDAAGNESDSSIEAVVEVS